MASLLAQLALLVVGLVAVVHSTQYDADLVADFHRLSQKFHKSVPEGAELDRKLGNFKQFKELVRKHQQQERGTATHGETRFFDLSPAEFAEFHTGDRAPANITRRSSLGHRARRQALPNSIDYRDYGVVSSVKDQGSCGDCFAFTSMAVLESALALQQQISDPNSVADLSEAQSTDCTYDYGCNGCHGGNGYGVFSYVKDNQGVTDEMDYPFSPDADHSTCQLSSNSPLFGANIDQISILSTEDDVAAQLVNYGPLYLGIAGDPLQTYTGGILDQPVPSTGWKVNHAVTVIGYGHDNESGNDYWICKNSWSESFGEQGYFRMVRGKNMLDMTSHPTAITLL